MSRSFSLQEEQCSLLSRESSFDPSFPGLGTSELRFLSHDEPRSEGYDEYFDPPLESKYECPICLLGLREPVQTTCGHRFCKGCIVRSIRDAGPKCPVDNEPLSEKQLYPDNFARREMMSHDVFCRMKKQRGCPWKGPLSELEKHLNECPFVDLNCPNECGKELRRKDLQQHLEKDCPLRKVPCKYCRELELWNALEVCLKFTLHNFKTKDLAAHYCDENEELKPQLATVWNLAKDRHLLKSFVAAYVPVGMLGSE